jgi:hypothetical protein
MMFHCSNYNIVLFLYYVKNLLEILHVFINAYNFYFILLYVNIDFLINNYIFLLYVNKRVNNTYIFILVLEIFFLN